MKHTIILIFFLTFIFSFGQENENQPALDETELIELYQEKMDSIEKTFSYQHGKIDIDNGMATLEIPEGYKYLEPHQANRVLTEIWGNPPSETLGLLLPENTSPVSDNFTYAIEITYEEEGYIADDDATDIDYDELLTQMQKDVEDANPERIKEGYESFKLIGWASEPYYDQMNKKLHWAKEFKFGESETNTLNYNIRILGRKGVLNLNVIGDMSVLPQVKNDIDSFLNSVDFNEGYRYTDFNPDMDKIAAYGIGGLIAGKVLAKTGALAVLLKFWKVIAIALAGGFAVLRKRFTGNKTS
ncbi:DUF2167 domain-containing protein [Abyssalbus ytuae]|uniref:DUF2167 domain-containing protein n=1 Tax=Abyssalbus ytuae TaxID=2926907 RepID=A0A9E7D1C9_9FLAO|nr:DUF2167 domain-containing protein [Abyssalbus ytuae]UOB16943.1 DUF2167 domain-containing protein [Abyssalbus ytuae]